MECLAFVISSGIDCKVPIVELAGIDAALASIAVHLESVPLSDVLFNLVP